MLGVAPIEMASKSLHKNANILCVAYSVQTRLDDVSLRAEKNLGYLF